MLVSSIYISSFLLGLLCAQGLTQLDLSFNSIVLLSEARKLAALEHLGSLSVNGIHFFYLEHI